MRAYQESDDEDEDDNGNGSPCSYMLEKVSLCTSRRSVASAAVFGKAEKENAKRNRPSSAKKQPGVQAVLIRGMLW